MKHYSGTYKHMVQPFLKARGFRLMPLEESRCSGEATVRGQRGP